MCDSLSKCQPCDDLSNVSWDRLLSHCDPDRQRMEGRVKSVISHFQKQQLQTSRTWTRPSLSGSDLSSRTVHVDVSGKERIFMASFWWERRVWGWKVSVSWTVSSRVESSSFSIIFTWASLLKKVLSDQSETCGPAETLYVFRNWQKWLMSSSMYGCAAFWLRCFPWLSKTSTQAELGWNHVMEVELVQSH